MKAGKNTEFWKDYKTRWAGINKTERENHMTALAAQLKQWGRRPPQKIIKTENPFLVRMRTEAFRLRDRATPTSGKTIRASQLDMPAHVSLPKFPKPVRNLFNRPQRLLYRKNDNYSFGTPNPDKVVKLMSEVAPYGNGPCIAARSLADPTDGTISLGICGGTEFDSTSGVFFKSPLPESWLLGDSIASEASLFQVNNVSGLLGKGKTLTVTADLINTCPGHLPDEDMLRGLDGLIALEPGLVTSVFYGLVGISGVFQLNLTTLSQSKIVGTKSKAVVFLQQCKNRSFGSGVYGLGQNYLVDSWLFTQPRVNLMVELPVDPTIDQLIVEANVRIVGYRGGQDTPGAGLVEACFGKNTAFVIAGYVPISFSPFYLRNVAAYCSV